MESVNPPPAGAEPGTLPGSDIGSLRREIHQSVPFPSASVEATLTIQRTADDLNAEFVTLLREHGLTPTQYNALRIIRGSGTEGLSTHEVGERLVKRDPDVPRLLERMVAAGLILRARSARDRRVTSCSITEKGRAVLDALADPVQRMHDRQFGVLSEAEQEQLVRLLDRVRAGLSRGMHGDHG